MEILFSKVVTRQGMTYVDRLIRRFSYRSLVPLLMKSAMIIKIKNNSRLIQPSLMSLLFVSVSRIQT